MQQLRRVLDTLARGEPLSPIHRDHGLKADYNKARACHIRGDWCLIYRIDEESNSLILIRLGTHSDLYNE